MTNREAIEWFRTKYAKVICDDCETPVGMAISALRAQDGTDTNVGGMISRQTAIDAVHKNYDTILDFKSDGRTVADSFEDIINALPSAQPEPYNDAAKRLNDLIFDINPAEICSQIKSDNLRNWCVIIQTEMKMATIQLPCQGEPMSDLIERQEAIDALDQIFDRCEEIEAHLPEGDPDRTGYKMYPDYMTVWKYLHQLPSAQSEP